MSVKPRSDTEFIVAHIAHWSIYLGVMVMILTGVVIVDGSLIGSITGAGALLMAIVSETGRRALMNGGYARAAWSKFTDFDHPPLSEDGGDR